MNYEAIILDLGNRIAQLTIDNAVLLSRVQDEMKNKEEVEKQYVELLTKTNKTATNKNIDILEQKTISSKKGGRF